MVPQLTDQEISLQAASLIAAATAGCGGFGKLAYSALVDRWDTRHALWLAVMFQVVGQIIMLTTSGYFWFMLGACSLVLVWAAS